MIAESQEQEQSGLSGSRFVAPIKKEKVQLQIRTVILITTTCLAPDPSYRRM